MLPKQYTTGHVVHPLPGFQIKSAQPLHLNIVYFYYGVANGIEITRKYLAGIKLDN